MLALPRLPDRWRAWIPPILTRPLPCSRRLRRAFIALLALLLFWTSLAWWLPPLLTPRLAKIASEQLGQPVQIGRLIVLPWMLRVEVEQLRIGEAAAPLLTLNRAMVDVSLRSIWDRAPVIDAIQLVDPVVHLAQSAKGQWNIAPIIARFASPPNTAAPNTPPPPFSLANVALINGRVVIDDARAGVTHHIDDLNITLPALSNLPDREYLPALPRLVARIDGSALAADAQAEVFLPGLPTRVNLHWQGIDLAKIMTAAAPYLPPALPLSLQQGQLGLRLQINSQQANAQNPTGMLHIGGDLALKNLAVQTTAQATLRGIGQTIDQLQVQGLSVDIPQRRAQVAAVLLNAPQTTVDLPTALHPATTPTAATTSAADPTANAPAPSAHSAESSTPVPVPDPTAQPAAPSSTPSPSTPWQWAVDHIQIQQGQITLQDPAWPQARRWQNLNATLAQVHDPASSPLPTAFTLSAQTADAAPANLTLTGSANLSPTPSVQLSTFALNNLDLAGWLRPWASLLPVSLDTATLSVAGQAQWQPQHWRVNQGQITLAAVHAAPRAAPEGNALSCAALRVEGIDAEATAQQAPTVHLSAVAADQLVLDATRDARGQWTALTQPNEARTEKNSGEKDLDEKIKDKKIKDKKPIAKERANKSTGTKTAAPTLDIAQLRCTGCAVTVIDQTVRPVARLGLKNIEFSAQSIDPAQLNRPIPFTFKAQSLTQGGLAFDGQIQPKPLALKARVDVNGLALAPIQPYLDPFVNIRLQSAALSTQGNLTLAGSEKTPLTRAQFNGDGALKQVFVRDRLTNSPFLRWQSLQLQRMAVNWSPSGLETDLGAVELNQFFGRVIINPDGHLNLSDIVKTAKNEATRSVTEVTPAPQTLPAGEASAPLAANPNPPPKLRWRSITVRGGQVDFTDHFIKPNYSAKITDLAGSVSALAWNDPTEANIALAGRVDGSAPVEIKGQANPLARPLALDITADTQGIELTRLSTYAARYAGYGIEKGSLSATLHYLVKDNQLTASNHIVLDQLTFGAPVDSPEATKLPVLLAVSLLQDRNGVIDIELPISGTLTDPEFSMGGIIVKVIVNLLTKAITAPFSLLASAFGGGKENLAVLPFDPGSEALGSQQTEQLDTLIKALNDRPQLKLDITGFADPAVDADGLKAARLLHEMKKAKAKATDQPVDGVTLSPEERTRWLTVVYKNTPLKDKPKNLVGLTKAIPDTDMEQRLLAAMVISPQDLEHLANQRADAVRAYLTAPGKIAPNRVGLTASHLGTKDQQGEGSTARVQFSLH